MKLEINNDNGDGGECVCVCVQMRKAKWFSEDEQNYLLITKRNGKSM